jgi:hypothetical protein
MCGFFTASSFAATACSFKFVKFACGTAFFTLTHGATCVQARRCDRIPAYRRGDGPKLLADRGAELDKMVLYPWTLFVCKPTSPSRAVQEIGGRGLSGGVVSRHFDDLDAVLESDTCDDLRQLVFRPSIVARFLLPP